ncbi:MAG: hypothetical protein WCT05_04970 [Lentisphaeria bacterium]
MPHLKKSYRRLLRTIGILLVLLLLLLELFFRFYGLPSSAHHLLEDSLAHAGLNCRFSWVKASIFSGFTFQGVTAKTDTPMGPLCLTAQELVITLNPLKLCQGQIVPDSIRLNAAKLQLITSNAISILNCQKFFFFARTLEKEKLSCNLLFSQNGIRIRGEAILANYLSLPQRIAELLKANDVLQTDKSAKITAFLELFQQRFQACEFGDNDAILNFSCQADAKDWNSFRINGDFDLNYGQIGPLQIHKQRGRFQYRNQILQLTDLRWLLSSDEQIRAELQVDFSQQTIAADFQGRLTPETCMNLALPNPPAWPPFLSCPMPISFQGKLLPAKWDFSNAEPEIACTVKSISIFGTHFQQSSFTLKIQKEILSLNNLVLGLDFRQNKGIRGNLQWQLREKRLSGNLEARFNLKEVLRDQGLTTDFTGFSFEDFDDVKLKVNLQQSPLDWKQWKIDGELSEAEGQEFGVDFQQLVVPFRMESAWLHIQQASTEINPTDAMKLTLDAAINLQDFATRQSLTPEFSLCLSPASSLKQPQTDILNINAKCHLDLQNNRFQLSEGKGVLIPDLFLIGFHEQFQRLYEPLNQLLSGSKPLQILFTIPEFELSQKDNWRILLKIAAEKAKFNQLNIHTVRADGEFSSRQLQFNNIKALVNDNEELSLDLVVRFSPPAIEVKNALIHGRPDFFEAFIFDDNACRIYRKIWENVRWDPQNLPAIHIPYLLYWVAPSNSRDWQLQIDATLELQNVFFKDFPIPGANIGLKLELPDSLLLNPVTLKTQQGNVNAKVAFSFSGLPNCSFTLDETEVPLDVILLLKSINENWRKFLDQITLHPQAKMQCNGFFDFMADPTIQIDGTIRSKEITFKKAQLKNVFCQWNFYANQLFWNIPEATFLDAELKNTGVFDFRTNAGESLLKIRNLPLDQAEAFFLTNPNKTRKNPLGGMIDSDCKVEILKNWADSPLYLEGNGHFSLREADLWQVPLMGNLASLLSLGSFNIFSKDKVSGLGNISKLEADFALQGNRLLVNHFNTNGTIIALNGNGEYSWEKDHLHFTVKGEALKNINILSFMLKPLSWAFDAELTGSIKKPEWKIRSALNKMFETE